MKTDQEYAPALLKFVGEEFLSEDERAELSDTTPLLESGVLDSLRIAVLLAFIRDELGVFVPMEKIDAGHFKDIRTIATMLDEASRVQTGSEGRA